MNSLQVILHGAKLAPLPSGSVWWPDQRLLCVSDLHLGKSDRIARRNGSLLPPYEVRDTLQRLEADILATQARTVICLGDSFDDTAAARSLPEETRLWIARLQAGRDWIWIEGNHDPGPVELGGRHLKEMSVGPLVFRHIADPGAAGEVSGHYHPKAQVSVKGRAISRPCFLVGEVRMILPAFGTYTGGLRWSAPELQRLMAPKAQAILLGQTLHPLPMPIERS
ncbi:MAG: ligase-associated DNA damage response endonuclease PdeM, partial [Alphaproteobacteria bacterium]|nr:ligase-associated DNA damage response endonuclease PdeM [Alphaproteobacteria bacterium]